ncbi:hypothetical protein L9F63_013726, partial [Diploptera punctata]
TFKIDILLYLQRIIILSKQLIIGSSQKFFIRKLNGDSTQIKININEKKHNLLLHSLSTDLNRPI